MSKKTSGLFSLFLFLFATQGFAQSQGNSPYSVFGLGEPASMTNIPQDAMGGTGVSFGNTFYVNLLNPAMVVKNRTVGGYKYVALNVGLKGRLNNIDNGTAQQQDVGLNLNNLAMAFPLKPNWATAVTLQPVSIMSHVSRRQQVINGNIGQSVTYDIQNKGSISRVSWVNSVRIGKPLYLGIETGYNFGTIFKDTTSSLGNGGATLLRNTNRTSLGGVSLKAGFAYQQKLNDKWQANIGGFYEVNNKLTGEQLRTFSTLADAGNGPTLVRVPDTLSIADVTTNIPGTYRIGVSLESPFKWIFAAEYAVKQYANFVGTDGKASPFLRNSQEFNAGIEYLPNSTSTKYFNQVFYRVGFRAEKTPFVISGTQVSDRSISLGLSVPMGFRNPSYLDVSAAFGQRGSLDNGLIRENYIKFGLSTSLLSSWFVKPRID